MVYDLTKIDSYKHLNTWLGDAKSSIREYASICLVGNKCDLKSQRLVNYNEVSKFCQDNSKKLLFIKI